MVKVQKKYAVYPGDIFSKTDGDLHYIGYRTLIQLYGVDPAECVNAKKHHFSFISKLITLSPRWDGNYVVPIS